jgi:hypothetical protein
VLQPRSIGPAVDLDYEFGLLAARQLYRPRGAESLERPTTERID